MNFLDSRVPESVWNCLTPCAVTGCWLWLKEHRLKFRVKVGNKQRPAHVLLYETMLGERAVVGSGHRFVRKCGLDICCNPHHLAIDIRSKRVDRELAGRTFGYLTVLEKTRSRSNGHGGMRRMWLCLCVCGQRKEIRQENLLQGEARSCGCKRYDLLVKDLTGKRFGKLEVLGPAPRNPRYSNRMWFVRCACGAEKTMSAGNLKKGTLSCGCTRRHGAARRKAESSEYNTWQGIKARCLNPKTPAYANYGGRGIAICERWLGKDGFQNFLADVGHKPPGRANGRSVWSLDRVDPNGNYEPGNVRWASQREQMQNTRTSRVRVARVLESLEGKDPELIAELRKQLLGVT